MPPEPWFLVQVVARHLGLAKGSAYDTVDHRGLPAHKSGCERYIEVRHSLLNPLGKEAEAARARVKARSGFEKLSADQSHTVLRSISEAVFDTTADAIAPSLANMQARLTQRLSHGEEAANERLDQLLSSLEEAQVVKLDAGLRGREIKNREELKRVLLELEERIGAKLDQGARIRLV